MQTGKKSNVWLLLLFSYDRIFARVKKKRVIISMKMQIKKKDWILIILIVVIAAFTCLLHFTLQDTGTEQVVVKINGAITATYDLNDDQEISLNNGSNILIINNGKADMIEADCPDKLCVEQRAISKNHESIICLPNKIIVEVLSAEESQIDGMTN